jgi:hypothetical protein
MSMKKFYKTAVRRHRLQAQDLAQVRGGAIVGGGIAPQDNGTIHVNVVGAPSPNDNGVIHME